MFSHQLEACQLRHMAACCLPRPAAPLEALALRPLFPVLVPVAQAGQLAVVAPIRRPLAGLAGAGARADLEIGLMLSRSQPLNSGPNTQTYDIFVRNFI